MKILQSQLEIRQKLERIARNYPLALSRLWVPYCHRFDGLADKSPRPIGCKKKMKRISPGLFQCFTCNITEKRTSQREALLSISEKDSPPIAFSVFGGNRSGKTQLGAMLTCAIAGGRDQWWVRQWLELNDLPDSIVPNRKPTTVISSALSYGDALAYIRPKIKLFLPADTRFRRWSAQDRAQAYLECGGRIISMSADSGRKRYQGIGGVSLCWLDEEHADGGEVFDECLLRTVDTKHNSIGILLTMTPLLGMTWTHEKFISNPSTGFSSYQLTGLDNPYISSQKMMKTIAHMSEESKASRLHGLFTNQAGLVYPEFDDRVHSVDSFDFSDRDRYQVFLTIDFGVVHPFVCLCCIYDKDDRLFVIDEYFMTEKTTVQNGHAIQAKFHKYKPFDFVIADSESKDGRMLLARQCNLHNSPSPKSGKYGVVSSINLVKERLSLDVEGNPRLYLLKGKCKHLRKEFRQYRWSKTSNGKDTPKKQNDDGLDALRYLCSFIHRYNSHF